MVPFNPHMVSEIQHWFFFFWYWTTGHLHQHGRYSLFTLPLFDYLLLLYSKFKLWKCWSEINASILSPHCLLPCVKTTRMELSFNMPGECRSYSKACKLECCSNAGRGNWLKCTCWESLFWLCLIISTTSRVLQHFLVRLKHGATTGTTMLLIHFVKRHICSSVDILGAQEMENLAGFGSL